MPPNGKRTTKKIDTKDWKKIQVEYGWMGLEAFVPPDCVEVSMKEYPPLSDPKAAIEKAFQHPIGSPPLEELIQNKGIPPEQLSVAIAVSDITRPLPYQGENGILRPLLRRLEFFGIAKPHIKIIVATGMHRASTYEEKVEMFGKEVVDQYKILDHDCQDNNLLISIGKTKRGTDVSINREFYLADLKIITGLVETHFMAGVSGGRKSICPGLVDLKTIQKFHGPQYLEDPHATNLILEGNPCHEEALEVARIAGVDFMVNVTLDKELRLTHVFAGDLVQAHRKAYEKIKEYVEVSLDREFDIVLTHGGYVGRDHYQTAKAGVGALPAIKEKGIMIIAASNHDPIDPIGSLEYRRLIHLLKRHGPDGYLGLLQSPHWQFMKDQWEPEAWARVIRKVGEKGLIYCSTGIPRKDYSLLPGVCGLDFMEEGRGRSILEKAQNMLQNAILWALNQFKTGNPSMAFVKQGPYIVIRPQK